MQELVDYLKENPGAEYNMKSLINTINNACPLFRFKCINNTVGNRHEMYYMVIKNIYTGNNHSLLYYKYVYCKDGDIYDYDNNIITPIRISFYDINKEDVDFTE